MNYKRPIHSILLILSFIIEGYYRIRRYFYRIGMLEVNSFNVPVISVGNLSLGGTGKTPISIYLANKLNKLDKSVVISMRGYKGKRENSRGVITASSDLGCCPIEYGDEPVLISRRFKNGAVFVGKNRAENLKYYFDKFLPDVVILDDGFQHLKVKRSLDIVLFNSLTPLSKYHAPPTGFLREGMSALKDADVVWIGRCKEASPGKVEKLKEFLIPYCSDNVLINTFDLKPVGVRDTSYRLVGDESYLRGKKIISLTALASPESFLETLHFLGADVVDNIIYADHHYFSLTLIESLVKRAADEDLLILVTEKDIVKIRNLSSSPRILFLEVDIEFHESTEEFDELLQKVTS